MSSLQSVVPPRPDPTLPQALDWGRDRTPFGGARHPLRTVLRLWLAVALTSALAGCGQKGPLFLPGAGAASAPAASPPAASAAPAAAVAPATPTAPAR
jgi:predicted small lipoprotein YifL